MTMISAGGHRGQALNPDVTEAARADDDHPGARAEHRDRLLHGVDRRQAGVR
jgi:hypothetical protein